MPSSPVIIVLTLAVLSGLSALAGSWAGDLDRLPMQWGLNGRPTGYAPKWVALGFIPSLMGHGP